MPSRKRAKGKARKAKARESNCNLILHNDSVCRHGCEVISKDDICYKFVEQLEVEMTAVYNSKGDFCVCKIIDETIKRMKARKEYRMIWDDNSKENQQKLQSLFINLGTNLLLRDSSQVANVAAAFHITSSHDFDYWDAMDSSRHRVSLRNMENGLVYDSAKFFHKRIPCHCLKKMYVQERSKPKLVVCSSCRSEKERRQLYLCSGCLYHRYCNVECQTAAWSKHKLHCKCFNPRTDCGL